MENNFISDLLKQSYIEKFNTGFSEHLRLTTELSCFFNAQQIAFLKNEYDAGFEKGGVIIIKPTLVKGQRVFSVKEIIFVTNTSETPERSYRPEPNELINARDKAIKNNLLPFNFHSHPTKGDNILFESLNYYSQLDTSDADKIYRYTGIQIGETKLRLPDILIVANGEMKIGLFIGFYGGLVAPLDFTERKSEVMQDFMQKGVENIGNYFDTHKKKNIGIAAAIAGIFLLFRYPKATVTTLLATSVIVPTIAYSSTREKVFFGISNGLPLKIILPKVSDEKIIENEKVIMKLCEEWIMNQSK